MSKNKLFYTGLFLLIIGMLSPSAFSQSNRKAPNLPNYDYKRLHFGFILGINNANFATKANTNLNPFDSIRVIETTPSLGFDVGADDVSS